ncbi:hypothetical protein LEP1GSC029_1335 [Leptospira interrogans str. 2002000626]|uniref:Uncharacterized protein n=2 Tax=Leptospira interrogans TaxID=173 RepID=A0A829D360_LEPIR|nr:hypothetical protein LEP1GSC029_1335 [Leptospira interrogans str. 2002000626]EMY26556.1 hypothetical protein LEP1GSC115_2225 [Leptospira interrogans serovar Australis str. 200703203]
MCFFKKIPKSKKVNIAEIAEDKAIAECFKNQIKDKFKIMLIVNDID